jgi:hypothetical protein
MRIRGTTYQGNIAMHEKQALSQSFSYYIFIFFLASGFFLWFCSVVSMVYELLYWLKTKIWLTLFDLLMRMAGHEAIPSSPWIQSLDSWYGLHIIIMRILESPLSLILFGFGFFMMLMCFPFSAK